ncbi:MAG: DnaB-like helicase C-terminal domain-containing protein [Dehalococcoidia bacterium]
MSPDEERIFTRHFVWLATHDVTFLRRYSKLIFPESYEHLEEQWLLQRALDFYEKYKEPLSIDALAVALEAKEERKDFEKESVIELYDADEPDEATREFLIDHSADWLRRRLSLMIVGEYAETIKAGRLEEAFEILNNGVIELSRSMDGEEFFDLAENVDEALDEIESMFKDDGTAIPTGIPQIDVIMQGGARAGELCVMLAPPGKGKSHWLVNIACEAWRAGKNVFYASFEMSVPRVNARILSNLTDTDSSQLHRDTKFVSKSFKDLRKSNKLKSSMFVKRYPDGGANVSELTSYIKHIEEESGKKIDLVIVDYGDQVAPMKRSDRGRVDDQAEVYKQLRAMAILLDVPVWTASQANRESLRKKVITIDNLADSFDKAKIADFILALCQTKEEKDGQIVRLFTAKVRNAGDGQTIWCEIDFSMSKFYEIEDPGEEDAMDSAA